MAPRRWRGIVAIAWIGFAGPALARDAPPDWLREAMRLPVGVPIHDADALGLLADEQMTVDKDGRVTEVVHAAIRVLTRAGRDEAAATVPYSSDDMRVKRLHAWLIPAAGQPIAYDDGDALDRSLTTYELYSDSRARVVSAVEQADTGAVFGYESIVELTPSFLQTAWLSQTASPLLRSRFSLTVPAGWKVTSVTFNHAPMPPEVRGGTYAWQLDDLPGIEVDDHTPPITSLAARVAVTWQPPADAGGGLGPSFGSWAEVSRWLEGLQSPAAVTGPELEATARRLVAGARTERDSIAAIARYVQQVRYAEIQLGLGRGAGFQPHPAAEVFQKSYGDCKDKANLLRTMLRVVGIPAWPVAAYAGDPGYVREQWPSPGQFNHCIVAVRVRHDIPGAPIVSGGDGGRLLFFDPTDPSTPFGQLPEDEQESLVLVVAPWTSGPTRLPLAPPGTDLTERRTQITLARDGSMTGRIHECRRGAAGADQRRALARYGRSDYRREWVEPWVAAAGHGIGVTNCVFADDSLADCFALELGFSAPTYAQIMQSRLMAFRPIVVSRDNVPRFEEATRTLPLALEARAWRESVWVDLPQDFTVDELPEPVALEESFGTYRFACAAREGRLLVTRSLDVRRTEIPAERYPQVRAFFDRVREVQDEPVVLVRP